MARDNTDVLHSLDDSYIRPVTFWVVGDFDSPSGSQLLYDAIRHMVGDPLMSPHLRQPFSEEHTKKNVMLCDASLTLYWK